MIIAMCLAACAGDAPPVDPSLYDRTQNEPSGSSTISGQEAGATTPQAPGSDAGTAAPPKGAGLCAPCTSSDACGGADDLCIEYGDGTFCGSACAGESCSAGFRCERVRSVETGKPVEQCVPLSGTCSADEPPDSGAAPRDASPDSGADAGEGDAQQP